MINGKNFQVYFQCVLVTGDNLGVNSICGFSIGFSKGKYYCRICPAYSEMCTQMVEENPLLYRKLTYASDVQTSDSRVTGIVEECVFNEIENHSITENYSVDDWHNFAEGIANMTVGSVLNALIKKKIPNLTVDVMNNRRVIFPYAEHEKSNKPRPFFIKNCEKSGEKLKVKQSATEMMCLVRYLGLMIGDLIPPNDEHWIYILFYIFDIYSIYSKNRRNNNFTQIN